MPILRPLLTYNKLEIIYLAEEIGTYDLSIEPYKDCCSIIQSNPRTRSKHNYVSLIEADTLPNYDQLIERTLADAICLEFACGQLIDQQLPD